MNRHPVIRVGQGEYARDIFAAEVRRWPSVRSLGIAAALGFLAVLLLSPILRGAGPGAQSPAADLSASGRGLLLPRPEDSPTTPPPVPALSGPGEGSRADQR